MKYLICTCALVAVATGALAQASLERVTFSSGGVDNNKLTATIGEPMAGFAKGGTGKASLSVGAQPGSSDTGVSIGNELSRDVTVFPNPTDGFVTVRIENTQINTFRVSVTDLTGRNIAYRGNCTHEERIDFTGLATGIYIVSVFDTNGSLLTSSRIQKQ